MPSNRRKRVWGRKFPLDKSHFITEMRNGGAAHFVILSGEKRRMLKNGLSETGELSRRI